MPTSGEHKTIQSRILAYAKAVGWTVVPRGQAEQRRGFSPSSSATDPANSGSLYFVDLLEAKVREFNPAYSDEPGALLGRLRQFQTTIHGNRDFVELLRNRQGPLEVCPSSPGVRRSAPVWCAGLARISWPHRSRT